MSWTDVVPCPRGVLTCCADGALRSHEFAQALSALQPSSAMRMAGASSVSDPDAVSLLEKPRALMWLDFQRAPWRRTRIDVAVGVLFPERTSSAGVVTARLSVDARGHCFLAEYVPAVLVLTGT